MRSVTSGNIPRSRRSGRPQEPPRRGPGYVRPTAPDRCRLISAFGRPDPRVPTAHRHPVVKRERHSRVVGGSMHRNVAGDRRVGDQRRWVGPRPADEASVSPASSARQATSSFGTLIGRPVADQWVWCAHAGEPWIARQTSTGAGPQPHGSTAGAAPPTARLAERCVICHSDTRATCGTVSSRTGDASLA